MYIQIFLLIGILFIIVANIPNRKEFRFTINKYIDTFLIIFINLFIITLKIYKQIQNCINKFCNVLKSLKNQLLILKIIK